MSTINCRVCSKKLNQSHIKSDCICVGCYLKERRNIVRLCKQSNQTAPIPVAEQPVEEHLACRVCEKSIVKSHIKSDCICSGCYQRSLPSWGNKISRASKKRSSAKNCKTNTNDFIAKAVILQSVKMAGDIHSQFADGLLNHFEMIEKFHQLYLQITNARDSVPGLHNLEDYMPEKIR